MSLSFRTNFASLYFEISRKTRRNLCTKPCLGRAKRKLLATRSRQQNFRHYELCAITETLSQNGFHCLFKTLLQALNGNMECNCGRTLSLDGRMRNYLIAYWQKVVGNNWLNSIRCVNQGTRQEQSQLGVSFVHNHKSTFCCKTF